MKNKIIELDNNEKYVVADTFSNSNKTYMVLGKLLNNNDIDNNIIFAELINNKVKKINDKNEINQLEEIYKLYLN